MPDSDSENCFDGFVSEDFGENEHFAAAFSDWDVSSNSRGIDNVWNKLSIDCVCCHLRCSLDGILVKKSC